MINTGHGVWSIDLNWKKAGKRTAGLSMIQEWKGVCSLHNGRVYMEDQSGIVSEQIGRDTHV